MNRSGNAPGRSPQALAREKSQQNRFFACVLGSFSGKSALGRVVVKAGIKLLLTLGLNYEEYGNHNKLRQKRYEHFYF